MVQCFLPQLRPKPGVTTHRLDHGRASLLIKAGELAHPEKQNVFKSCVVPWGAKARLIIPYINRQAVVKNSPVIDLGTSLRDFMTSVGVPVGGRNGRAITNQIENIAAAQFILGEWDEHGATTKRSSVSNEITFWLERDASQVVFWNPEMVLSPEYFQSILERPVPVDMGHLTALQGSPRRMDLYGWFAYRLPQIRKGKTVRIPLRLLQPIFAPGIQSRLRLFKQRLKSDLKAIHAVYPHFSLTLEGDMLILRKSPPPVPLRPRSVAVLKAI